MERRYVYSIFFMLFREHTCLDFSATQLSTNFNITARQATETKKATRRLFNNSRLLVILPCEYRYKIQQRGFSTAAQTEQNSGYDWMHYPSESHLAQEQI